METNGCSEQEKYINNGIVQKTISTNVVVKELKHAQTLSFTVGLSDKLARTSSVTVFLKTVLNTEESQIVKAKKYSNP